MTPAGQPRVRSLAGAIRLPLAVALLLAIAAAVLLPARAGAQTPAIVDTTIDTSNFPLTLTFRALVDDGDAVESAVLFYQVPPEGAITRQPAEISSGGVVRLEAELPTNTARTYIPPGATIEWWWALTTNDGDTIETARSDYSYVDPRYEWKVIADDVLELYYYENEDAAEALHQAGRDAISHMSQVLGAEIDFPARIYLWSNAQDATGVERVESSRFEQLIFTGGTRVLADLVHVFAPEPWIVVHELTHILTKVAGEGIAALPAWLDEGTATYAEGAWRSRRGIALQRALDNDDILSVRSIGSSTNTPGDVDLFYGQSADIVTALIDEFGDERFADLFAVFKRGATVDDALMEVYGFDREGLDAFYRTQRGLEARGEVEDRSTQIEDEQIGPAGTEQSGEAAQSGEPAEAGEEPAEAPADAAPDEAADAPADEAAADSESDAEAAVDEADAAAAGTALEGRQQAVEDWNSRVRLGPTFGGGSDLPWPEIATGAGGAALLLSLLALFIALGRVSAPAPVAPPSGPDDAAAPPAPPSPPSFAPPSAAAPSPPAVAREPGPDGAWAGWRHTDDDAPAEEADPD